MQTLVLKCSCFQLIMQKRIKRIKQGNTNKSFVCYTSEMFNGFNCPVLSFVSLLFSTVTDCLYFF